MKTATTGDTVKTITTHYIDGSFVESHGREVMNVIKPTNGQVIARVTLGDEEDTRRAIAAARRAFATFGRTTKEERAKILRRLHETASARIDELTAAMIEEYGGVAQFSRLIVESGVNAFSAAEKALDEIPWKRQWGKTTVTMEPVGVAGMITAWNANALFICLKLASAVAAGCTVVLKPSELSSLQTQVMIECVNAAKLPKGVCNVVIGRGDVVGAELVRNPDVDKISFTGSTAAGKRIMSLCGEQLKRVSLELGGKSAAVILDDADLDTTIPGLLGTTLVRREPVGVVGAIVPWNVPLYVTMSKLAPALVAGCTIVLKPAPETPLDAYILAEAFAEAGLPKGVLNIVSAGREVGEHLVKHPDVDKISFTGSTAAGKRIMSLCGEQLKRVSLELGGKSAAVILDDADLDTTIPGLLPNSLMNNGEACVAQTRILAPRDRYQEVVDRLVEAVRAMPVGDPMDPATQIGPLVASRQRDRVEGYIAIGQEEGAKVAIGGGRPAGADKGWYVEPTVFVGVDNKMRIAQEEIFGPVVAVIPYDGEADAVRIANDSSYGLSGTVWTADPARGVDVARKVRTGTYTVNGFVLDFATPFGGFKQSGIGRELGPEGLEEYLELKSVNLPAGYTP